MRLFLCAVSAIALSGCSWLGDFGQSHSQYGYNNQASHNAGYGYNKPGNPCLNLAPQQPIPIGCQPQFNGTAQNNFGATNGFPQQPQFSKPEYATGQFGTHASLAHNQGANHRSAVPSLRKPKFRGALSLGAEKSFSGDLFTFDNFPIDPATGLTTNPTSTYVPNDYAEGRVTGSPTDGAVVTTTYTAGPREPNGLLWDEVKQPAISFDDVWSTPTRIALGGEYIVSPKNTLFANFGYSAAEGKTVGLSTIEATLFETTSTQIYDTTTFAPIGGPITSVGFVPNEDIASFTADFSDLKRYDLEFGARHYFDPVNKKAGLNTITPFVGASIGASKFNEVSYKTDQTQRYYERAYNGTTDQDTFYDIDDTETQVTVYDSQWVPSGQLNAGVEWQVTPRTGLAFETGLRFEGARDYANDVRGDANIAVPFTIRGSYNF